MGRRGFFAEVQYQAKQAEKRQIAAARAAAREHDRAVREWERAQRDAEKAQRQAVRAAETERKAAEKEAKRLLVEAREAEVQERNANLAQVEDEISGLLEATLGVDDFVDLEQLRVTVEHPPFPFPHTDLETPIPSPELVQAPPAPVYVEPPAPTGLSGVFGGKKKHQSAVAQAKEEFEAVTAIWQAEVAKIPERQRQQLEEHQAKEAARQQALKEAREVYAAECEGREQEAAESNARLDAIIAGLAIGEPQAVTEYVGIVLSNSVYPDILEVEHEFDFDPVTCELSLTVLVTPPDRLPSEKAFRYVKAKDEIASSSLSQKALRERYKSLVEQVALRTMHEVFEADRREIIKTISLHVAANGADPATGQVRSITFVGVAASRETFTEFELANVVPAATLERLGAAVAKNPLDLDGLDGVTGIRSQ